MPDKVLNRSNKSAEKKANTAIVKGTLTLKQKEAIRKLIGVLGSNEQDVIGKILTMWLFNGGYLRNENE